MHKIKKCGTVLIQNINSNKKGDGFIMNIVIGLDNGNANTKTEHVAFTSGVMEHITKPPMAKEVIYFQDKYYSLTTSRMEYERDKTKDNRCFILSLFAIAKELIETGAYQQGVEHHMTLGVDLPPEHFSVQRRKFAQYFTQFGNPVRFSYNEKPFILSINPKVFVYPQGYAAAATKASDVTKYSRYYIVDIGGYTTDVMLIVDNVPDLSCCYSLESGIISMNNKIKRKISSAFDIMVDERHIEDVLAGRPTVLDGNDKVIDEIKKEVQKHANGILNELREYKVDLRANPAFFLGGGSVLLEPFIRNSGMVSFVEFIPDICANATGCAILTKAALGKNL